tara:strand:+ start:407 stop:700 length:294 start_codon:yes stop_codon:yes gene_type:complete
MEQYKSITRFTKILVFVLLLSSCENDSNFDVDCLQCLEYSYLQAIDDSTSISLTLNEGIYCIGDSAWQAEPGFYWTILDSELIIALFQSEYCDTIDF